MELDTQMSLPDYIAKARETRVCPECDGPKTKGALTCRNCWENRDTKLTRSPYYAIKRGSVGEIVGKKFAGTRNELWRVRFSGGSVWSLRPQELTTLVDEDM